MQPFFTKHKECDVMSNENIFDKINYNFKLFAEYHKDNFDCKDKDELGEQVYNLFCEYLGYSSTYFEPTIFKEQIAFECGLTPFTTDRLNLLALTGCGMDFSPMLDAYQVLTNNTIDKESYFFSDINYFGSVVGKSITEQVKKIISY